MLEAMLPTSKWISWYHLQVRDLRAEIEAEYEDKLKRAQKLSDQLLHEEREKSSRLDSIRVRLDAAHYSLILSKDSLLTQKEQMDIAKIVNSSEYQSLRSYYLKTVVLLQERAAAQEPTASHVIVQFAKLLKDYVFDMDRLKLEHPDEASPTDYGE